MITRPLGARIAAEPGRLIAVERHEPLFQMLAERGYSWRDANTLDRPTQRAIDAEGNSLLEFVAPEIPSRSVVIAKPGATATPKGR